MKKLFIITLTFLVLACGPSETPPPVYHTIKVEAITPFAARHDGIFWLTSGLVADFDHVYDSIDLTATNKGSQLQQFFKSNTPALSAQLTQGDYLFYMTSNRYMTPKPVERIVQFSARRDSVKVTASTPPIMLNDVFTKQSLILIKKTGITGTPTIKVGTASTVNMYTSANYFYAYTTGTSCTITTTVSGKTTSRTITTAAFNIYSLSLAGASIDIVEPFKTLIVV